MRGLQAVINTHAKIGEEESENKNALQIEFDGVDTHARYNSQPEQGQEISLFPNLMPAGDIGLSRYRVDGG